MADATNTEVPVAFFWSAVTTLPADWETAVTRALNHLQVPGLMAVIRDEQMIAVYDVAWSDEVPAVCFHFPHGRGAGQVRRVGGDRSIVAALRIAQVLALDLSDKDGNALPKDRPREWLSQVDFTGSADEVEAIAEQLGLIAKRYSLEQMARPDAEKETRLFF